MAALRRKFRSRRRRVVIAALALGLYIFFAFTHASIADNVPSPLVQALTPPPRIHLTARHKIYEWLDNLNSTVAQSLVRRIDEFSLPSWKFLPEQYQSLLQLSSSRSGGEDTEYEPAPSIEVKPGCSDPYKTAGWLFTSAEDHTLTRWIPFYSEFHDLPEHPLAAYPRVEGQDDRSLLNDKRVDPAIMALAPPPWTKMFHNFYLILRGINYRESHPEEARELTDEEKEIMSQMGWVRDRTVLLVGDSIDRNMITYFCSELNLEFQNYGGPVHGTRQTTASCHVPFVNFTIVQWHVAGMFTSRPEWWWEDHMNVVPFEERFAKIFEKYSLASTISRYSGHGPDLVLFQSGSWDERGFREAAHYEAQKEVPFEERVSAPSVSSGQLSMSQLRFINSRMQKLVQKLRSMFSDDTPLMYRSLSFRRDGKKSDLALLSIDRMHRSMVQHLGIEVFDWSLMSYGFTEEFKDSLHFRKGALSWLWSDMLLHYLFRAAGGIEDRGKIIKSPPLPMTTEKEKSSARTKYWDRCHNYLVGQDNR
ncbi:hypothetical protein BZA70DRAFT_271141 [Myxozyma melibiosi]|uniref:Uncharacterized protein n=1 Tax=Myxozyma melibiosi TaxID=54550 RepID=A0ABR1FC03_9ASCO